MKGVVRECRLCGRPVCVIDWGIYRKTLVDAEAVYVVPDIKGEDFVRYDGRKIRGREAEIGTVQAEPAYRPHRKNCGRFP